MIIIKLKGGLGNQMFQYAFGKKMALLNTSELVLDLTELLTRDSSVSHTNREFEIDIFNIHYFKKQNSSTHSLKERIIRKFFTKAINENSHIFSPDILNAKGNLYLNGFWQNELYFKDIEQIIRDDFKFKNPPASRNKQMLLNINNCNSVSIHFRRGDYVYNKNASNYHGTCSEEYYKKSISYMKTQVENPHFYIFSDEIDWVKNNFQFYDEHTFVDLNNEENNFEDLRLMSNCKHNIIANSSFSWWGAWLNANIDKIVIAPKRWFINQNTDIVPECWVKIDGNG